MDVDVAALQARLRITFKRPELLAQSMVHRSYLNEAIDPGLASNERMEFLGDAVLGCVVARWLYDRYPAMSEGRLTELRASVVKGETLAGVADRLRLGDFLVLGRGEEATGGRRRPINLGRVFEAVLGAIYLDRGFATTERFIVRTLGPELASLREGDLPPDAKSRLQHLSQTHFGTTPRYRLIAAEGPDHAKTFTVEVTINERLLGSGQGRSKHTAEAQAAQQALLEIEAQALDAAG